MHCARNRTGSLTERRQHARLVGKKGSADFKQTSVALIAPARCFRAAPLWFTAKLLFADEGERGAEPLVLDNHALVDLLDLVEGAVGQRDALVEPPQ